MGSYETTRPQPSGAGTPRRYSPEDLRGVVSYRLDRGTNARGKPRTRQRCVHKIRCRPRTHRAMSRRSGPAADLRPDGGTVPCAATHVGCACATPSTSGVRTREREMRSSARKRRSRIERAWAAILEAKVGGAIEAGVGRLTRGRGAQRRVALRVSGYVWCWTTQECDEFESRNEGGVSARFKRRGR